MEQKNYNNIIGKAIAYIKYIKQQISVIRGACNDFICNYRFSCVN